MPGWVLAGMLGLALAVTIVSNTREHPEEKESFALSGKAVDSPESVSGPPRSGQADAFPVRSGEPQRVSGVLQEHLGIVLPGDVNWKDSFLYFRKHYKELTFLTDMTLSLWMEEDVEAVFAFLENHDPVIYSDWKTVGECGARLAPERTFEWIRRFVQRNETHAVYHGYFGVLGEEDPLKALALASSLNIRSEWGGLSSNIYIRWSHEDFNAAFAHAMANLQGNEKRSVILGLINSHTGSIEEKTMLINTLDGDYRKIAIQRLVQSTANQSPQEALRLFDSFPEGEVDSSWLYMVFHQWGRTDPLAALEAAGERMGSGQQAYARNIINNWANHDLDGVLAAMRAGQLPVPNHEVVAATLHAASRNQPERLFDLISYVPDQELAATLQHSGYIFEHLKLEELNLILDRLPTETQQVDMIASWVGNNQMPFETATALFESLPEGARKNNAEIRLLARMAGEDPVSAIAYIEEMPLGQHRTRMARSIMQDLLNQHGLERGMAFYEQLPFENNTGSITPALADYWMRQSPEKGIEAAMALPDVRKRDALLASIAERWARSGLHDVETWLATVSDPALREKLTIQAYQGLTQYDPVLAVQKAENLGSSPERDRILQSAGQQWINRDVFGAAEWIGTLETGNLKDRLIGNLTRSVQEDHPEYAFDWALQLNNQRTRQNTLNAVARVWAMNNPEALRNKIKSSQLSSTERNTLQRLLDSRN